MSEQINKVLVDRAQAFSSAEQAQARDNIGAMAASASALFGISSCSANAPLTGDGTSGSPLGLSSRITLASAGAMNDMTPSYQQFTASNLSSLHQAGYSDYEQAHYTSWIDPQKVIFKTDSGAQEQVDYSSIQRWNSYSSNTGGTVSAGHYITGDGSSGSPLGLDSYAVFESSNSSNSVGRRGMTVTTSGSLGKTAWYYAAFASLEDSDGNTANYRAKYADFNNGSVSGRVDASSIYSWNHPNYYCIIRTPGASTTNVVTTASYPTGLTADARLDVVHLGDTSYSYVVYDKNSSGATQSITAGQTGTVWWVASASAWTSF